MKPMLPTGSRIQNRAFTLIELVLVIVIIGILAARLMPALSKARTRADRAWCTSNLKQVGVGFQIFANEHRAQFPMHVYTRDGGSLEYVAGGNAYRHFQVLSNELVTPKILKCPSDKTREPALNWTALRNTNISFFVAVDATPQRPDSILSGDRNISQDSVLRSNVLQLTTPDNVAWTSEIHVNAGNLLFSDGRVEQVNTERLRIAFRAARQRN